MFPSFEKTPCFKPKESFWFLYRPLHGWNRRFYWYIRGFLCLSDWCMLFKTQYMPFVRKSAITASVQKYFKNAVIIRTFPQVCSMNHPLNIINGCFGKWNTFLWKLVDLRSNAFAPVDVTSWGLVNAKRDWNRNNNFHFNCLLTTCKTCSIGNELHLYLFWLFYWTKYNRPNTWRALL